MATLVVFSDTIIVRMKSKLRPGKLSFNRLGKKRRMEHLVIGQLAEVYPQLYLDPDKDEIEAYRAIVRRGEQPPSKDLSQYHGDPRDRLETLDTPVGPVTAVFLHDRADFELFIRNMMASKNGPRDVVPKTQGAATLIAFNWPRIFAHKEAFLLEAEAAGEAQPDWGAEFKRFTAEKANYQDVLVVLSAGPYSNVAAADVGLGEGEWLAKSLVIRQYHECTHVVCRKRWPEKTDAVWDELVADAIGIYAAFGRFDALLEQKFLGIRDGAYAGGRLQNYTDHIDVARINAILADFASSFAQNEGAEPFDMIEILEAEKESW